MCNVTYRFLPMLSYVLMVPNDVVYISYKFIQEVPGYSVLSNIVVLASLTISSSSTMDSFMSTYLLKSDLTFFYTPLKHFPAIPGQTDVV